MRIQSFFWARNAVTFVDAWRGWSRASILYRAALCCQFYSIFLPRRFWSMSKNCCITAGDGDGAVPLIYESKARTGRSVRFFSLPASPFISYSITQAQGCRVTNRTGFCNVCMYWCLWLPLYMFFFLVIKCWLIVLSIV